MIKKEKDNSKEMFNLLDTMFNNINQSHKNKGTGLFFRYDIAVSIDKDDETIYSLSILLDETGHAERILQAFSYLRPKDMNKFDMEYAVILNVLTVLTETALVQWNEFSKMLNADPELQKVAKETRK